MDTAACVANFYSDIVKHEPITALVDGLPRKQEWKLLLNGHVQQYKAVLLHKICNKMTLQGVCTSKTSGQTPLTLFIDVLLMLSRIVPDWCFDWLKIVQWAVFELTLWYTVFTEKGYMKDFYCKIY